MKGISAMTSSMDRFLVAAWVCGSALTGFSGVDAVWSNTETTAASWVDLANWTDPDGNALEVDYDLEDGTFTMPDSCVIVIPEFARRPSGCRRSRRSISERSPEMSITQSARPMSATMARRPIA